MFDPGLEGSRQLDSRLTKQVAQGEMAAMQKDAARRAQVREVRGGRRTPLGKRIRHWYLSLMGRKPAEH
jgi:hypothetical protein